MQTDISTLEALLARAEAATGPDRGLDAAILEIIAGYRNLSTDGECQIWDRGNDGYWTLDGDDRNARLPSPTASIDTALALMQEKLPGWFVSLDSNGKNIGNFARVYNDGLVHEPSFTSTGNKPIQLLALAALLEALIAQSKEQGHG